MAKRKTTSDFIIAVVLKYGDSYNYTRTEYLGFDQPVTITCPEHGDFSILPKTHISSGGCKTCRFIEKAKSAHGDKYDYSKTVYLDHNTKLTYTCARHGDIHQTPREHLKGAGCIQCGYEKSADDRRIGLTDWIARARKAHGDKYNYSLVTEYSNKDTKVKIICPTHGVFEQLAGTHAAGGGCRFCHYDKLGRKNASTRENFIVRAVQLHGSKYDYSETKYESLTKEVTILAENFVQVELASVGVEPSFSWKRGAPGIEFVVTNQVGDVIPVEVKGAARTKAKSLKSYVERYAPVMSVKLIDGPSSEEMSGDLITLPVYYVEHILDIVNR
ncbi:hypothetical protein [Photobacterium rosenbergii]|uniref:hypothetical protein n=1 Tax=Photobacterium rosenbergii TaxID=294936 RepID=UPI001C98E8DB|nr:hypothetical protein [Photobacterium rosenbergii]MBY5944780.1 hypothetical protein [Photobacterium rosenbergii]